MKTTIKSFVFLAATSSALHVFAGTMGQESPAPLLWSVNAAVGYADFNQDGDASLGRISISRDVAKKDNYSLGFELGVQQFFKKHWSRDFYFNNSGFYQVNGPLQFLGQEVSVNPWIDLMVVGQIAFADSQRLFVQGKAGMMYRNWDLRQNWNAPAQRFLDEKNRSDFAYEAQLGLGYHLSERVSVTIAYQGIVRANFIAPYTTLRSDIPTSNGGLLGVSLTL